MKRWLLILFVLIVRVGCAQDIPPVKQQQLENTADATESEDPDDDDFLSALEVYKKLPLNLNTASFDELRSLTFLNDLQIENFLRYRKLLGSLLHIYELQAVPAWDIVTIRRILPFVTIESGGSMRESLMSRMRGEHSFLLREARLLERAKGYDRARNNHYLGSPDHLLLRYRYQYKNLLYFGVTGEKDAGEQIFRGAQSAGFDFYSFHFFARRLGIIKSIAVGDYTVNLGQGLIQWQSMAFGKSAEVLSVKRQSEVLSPYRASGEFYFNRGIGITLQKKNLETSFFGSYKSFSGNIVNDSAVYFTSLLTSGYHRNAPEIEDRSKVRLLSAGMNIKYTGNAFKIGWNAVAHRFSIPLQKSGEPYNRYAPGGRDLFNSSIDYSYTFHNMHFFGEAAVDRHFHRALVNGGMISLDPAVDLAFLYRKIQKEFQSLFGNAFTESTTVSNENGIYAGISVRPVSGWQVNAYADFFYFLWLRYRVNAPTSGREYLLQVNYQPNKQFGIYARYRDKSKQVNGSGAVINYPTENIRKDLRIHFGGQLSKLFSIASRAEMVWFRKNSGTEEGFLRYLQASFSRGRLSSDLRFCYFETESYDSRIYAYESDVLYSNSIPAFYGHGLRYYLNAHYKLRDRWQCWIRLSRTVYEDRQTTGGGLDEIGSPVRTEIKLQVQYGF